VKTSFLHVPPQIQPTRRQKIGYRLMGSMLGPLCWLAAHRYGTPGLGFHGRCALLGLSLLVHKQAPLALGWCYDLMFRPMDSTRYFEFDFAWRCLSDLTFRSYLDVSSPRLFPLLLLRDRPLVEGDLINPDGADLAWTAKLAAAAGLASRCRTEQLRIQDVFFASSSFQVITSLSVLEHVPEDNAAVGMMWDLLRPGGRLVITLPVRAEPAEQYIDRNEYGVLAPDAQGLTFWQRFYDERMLQERIFSITGTPSRLVVYGEKRAGLFQSNAALKRASYNTTYPFWREPVMMGEEYEYFPGIGDLPGEGAIGLEFVKS
jgi:SAM-dependent methyltransferase